MNILLLSPELFRADGGIARIMRAYLKGVCDGCGPSGQVDSLVLNDQPGGDPRLSLYSNSRLRRNEACAGSRLRFVTRAVRFARTADLLVCGHLHHLPIALLAQAFHPGLRYSLVAHGIEVWRPYSWLERRALLGAHRILCVSDYTRRQLRRFLPTLAPERLIVVPNTLDPYFADNSTRPFVNSPFIAPRILTVARLATADRYKGIDTLIEALPHLHQLLPLARLRVVGQGDDLPRLRALAASLGVARAVEFTGAVDDETLRAEYETCDLFALPSRREGFGLVYLEAMAHGKPCVGARAGGVPEVINDSVGQLVEYGRVPELAEALAELVRRPRDSEVVRRHAASFAFPVFQRRLAAALS